VYINVEFLGAIKNVQEDSSLTPTISLIDMKVASKPSDMGYYSTKAGLGKVGQTNSSLKC
jgi:hypothetical protein